MLNIWCNYLKNRNTKWFTYGYVPSKLNDIEVSFQDIGITINGTDVHSWLVQNIPNVHELYTKYAKPRADEHYRIIANNNGKAINNSKELYWRVDALLDEQKHELHRLLDKSRAPTDVNLLVSYIERK